MRVYYLCSYQQFTREFFSQFQNLILSFENSECILNKNNNDVMLSSTVAEDFKEECSEKELKISKIAGNISNFFSHFSKKGEETVQLSAVFGYLTSKLERCPT